MGIGARSWSESRSIHRGICIQFASEKPRDRDIRGRDEVARQHDEVVIDSVGDGGLAQCQTRNLVDLRMFAGRCEGEEREGVGTDVVCA